MPGWYAFFLVFESGSRPQICPKVVVTSELPSIKDPDVKDLEIMIPRRIVDMSCSIFNTVYNKA